MAGVGNADDGLAEDGVRDGLEVCGARQRRGGIRIGAARGAPAEGDDIGIDETVDLAPIGTENGRPLPGSLHSKLS